VLSPVEAREILPRKTLARPFDGEEKSRRLVAIQRAPSGARAPPVTIPWTWMWCSSVCPQVWEHQGKTEFTAEPLGIASERLQGGRGAPEEEAVEDLGIALGQGVELVREGQDTMKIGNV